MGPQKSSPFPGGEHRKGMRGVPGYLESFYSSVSSKKGVGPSDRVAVSSRNAIPSARRMTGSGFRRSPAVCLQRGRNVAEK